MKRSIKPNRKIIGVFGIASCGLIGWLATAREIPTTQTPVTTNGHTLQFSEPNVSRVKERLIMGTSEVVFDQQEAGQLVYTIIDSSKSQRLSPNSTAIPSYSTQIVLHNLGDLSAEGHLVTTYKVTTKQFNRYMEVGYIDDPQISPGGQYLLLSYLFINSTYPPIVLDIKKGKFHQMASAGISDMVAWSPDNFQVASFEQMYDERGAFTGEIGVPDASRRVFTQDWRSNQSMLAANAQGISNPVTWLDERTLLYGSLPQDRKKKFELFDVTKKMPRTNIYGYSTQTRQTKLLVKDGYRPYPSPNGKLIAFFGSRDPDHPRSLRIETENPRWLWRYYCSGASLCVANADGSHRIAFHPYYGIYPRIQWLPDNKRFVTMERTQGGPHFEAEIRLWNIQTQGFKKLATLQVSDAEESDIQDTYSELRFPFALMGVSVDGKKIFVDVVSGDKSKPSDPFGFPLARHLLQSIEIETGKMATVATITGASGFDWKPTASAAH